MNKRLEVQVPYENVNDPSAKVLSWAVPSGTAVKEGDIIAVLENSKTTFEVSAPAAGIVEYSVPVGQEVAAGEALFFILVDAPTDDQSKVQHPEKPESPITPPAAQVDSSAAATVVKAESRSPVFSQKALKLIEELGIDASLFFGMVMVRESDVQQKLSAVEMGGKAAGHSASLDAKQVNAGQSKFVVEEGDEVQLERSKTLENRQLSAANSAALRSTIYYLCPTAGFGEACSKQSPPINRLAVILFEVVNLLTKHRYLNACYLDHSAFLYRHVHIGFAVDIERGLKVLVIRKAEELTFPQIAAKVEELLVKYTTNTLATVDVTGSTFTVTDLSQEGIFSFEPLLNNRQAAILAIGAEQAGIPGFMFSCTFDHRLTAGKVVGEFLRELSSRLSSHAESIRRPTSVESQPACSRCLETIEGLRIKNAFLVPSVEPVGYICSLCLDGY